MFGFAKKIVSTIESQLTATQDDSKIDESRQGLRILSVKKNSIGSKHGFESWFDFIVALNGTDICAYLDLDSTTGQVGYENMLNYIRHEVEVSGEDITFTVFSSKGSIMRDIRISASEIKETFSNTTPPLEEINFSADANDTSSKYQWTPNLGILFQLTPLSTGFFMWHVLRVHPASPAYSAGITPDEYIIQSQEGLLATGGEDLLAKVLQSQYSKVGDGCEVVLYVYNYDSDCVRPVRVILKSGNSWGGRGILGCDVGYGLLHRIPEVIGKFQTKSADQHLPGSSTSTVNGSSAFNEIVPEIPLTQPPEFLPLKVTAPSFDSEGPGETADQAATAVFSTHKKRSNPATSNYAAVNLEAYFEEQTKSNQDVDSGNTVKDNTIPLPPPMKKI